jgi:hypothetical protein
MKSETGKLPKGQSYPLKPSALEAALAEAHVDIDRHLIRSPGQLFYAYFWPPNPNVPYERLYVRIGSVPSELAADTRRHVEAVTIPRLVGWIAGILAADRNSPIRREKQYLNLGGGLVFAMVSSRKRPKS